MHSSSGMKSFSECINLIKSNQFPQHIRGYLFPKRTPGKGNGSAELELHIKQLEEQILDRKEERKSNIMETLLSFRNRPIREINITYPLGPDQFARIAYDSSTEELVYIPVEPVIEGKEIETFRMIKGIFESDLDLESIQTNRYAYIDKKVAEIID